MVIQGNIVSRDKVVLEWLKSEKWKIDNIPDQLIENPNLNDPTENQKRLNILAKIEIHKHY